MLTKILNAIASTFYYFFPEIEAARIAQRQKDRLQQLFVIDNKLRNLTTGQTVIVREVDFAGAMLENASGRYLRTDWISATGKILGHIADQWEMSPRT